MAGYSIERAAKDEAAGLVRAIRQGNLTRAEVEEAIDVPPALGADLELYAATLTAAERVDIGSGEDAIKAFGPADLEFRRLVAAEFRRLMRRANLVKQRGRKKRIARVTAVDRQLLEDLGTGPAEAGA